MPTRPTTCPQCKAPVIQPRTGGDYCEECGWPDENRKPASALKAIESKRLKFFVVTDDPEQYDTR
jgi:uncharacterized Zn finger protein (UPF0148 family)